MIRNLAQLRTFERVARTGNLSAAARSLGVSQPAVSGQIARLEREHATALFERVRRRLVLTAAGRGLLQDVRRVFAVLDEAEQHLAQTRDLRVGVLRLAASVTSSAYDAPELMIAFRGRHPGVSVELFTGNSTRVVERVVALEADVGLIAGDVMHREVARHLLFLDPVVLVVPRRHALARHRTISIARLAGEPLVLREAGSATRALIEQQFAANGVDVKIAMEVSSNEAIKRIATMGQGFGVVSRRSVVDEMRGGHLRAVELHAGGRPIRQQVYLVHHVERRDALLVRAVLETVRELHTTHRWRAPSEGIS
jgi:LysR family transcriptional regulator, low CO2-responsive transcriptional regulator